MNFSGMVIHATFPLVQEGKRNLEADYHQPSLRLIDSPVAVVVELVVGAECEERPDAHAVRVEDLGAAVDPALAVGQPVPVRREQELDAVEGALQRQRLARQDGQDDVGEHGREPHDLEVAHARS